MAQEIRTLIRKMSMANPRWGSPRIVGELAKLGIHVAKATVEKCVVRPRKPPSPTWRAFLENHPEGPRIRRLLRRAHGLSIRRECLDHVIVLNEHHLRRVLGDYLAHYHRWRCHRSLEMDCPVHRPVQGPEHGSVIEVAEAGGLYRHYARRAA